MIKTIAQIAVIASLLIVLPAIGEVQDSAANNPSINPTHVGAPSSETDNANFNSQAFGWHGPFTATGYYSSKLGSFLDLKYVNDLNNTNTFAFELGFGSDQFRIGGTWAHELTLKQRFKITLEHLAQNIQFNYVTGSDGQWVGQNAIGAGYQYLLQKRWISSIEATAYYADAENANLGEKKFKAANGTPMIDQRRMAGARSTGFSAGVHMQPWSSGLIGVALNYDSVVYDTKYEPGDDTSGIGGTISFDQIVTPRFKFGLMASDRKPWSQYSANVTWLAPSWAGTRLQLGVVASHITGDIPESGDNRLGLQLLYTWGGDPMVSPLLYTVPTLNGPTSLLAYVNTPAVHMPQVLVVKDERVITDPNAPPLAQVQTINSASATTPIVLVPNKPVMIKASQYFAQAPSTNVSFNASQLPTGLHMDSKSGTISGELPKTAVGMTYNITVQAEPVLNMHKPGVFLDLQPASQELTLSVMQAPDCTIPSKIQKNADDALTGSNAINIAQYCTGTGLKYSISNAGSANISINNTSGIITGPVQAPNTSTVTLNVSNEAGSTSPSFVLAIVVNQNVISQAIPDQWAAIGQGFNLNVTSANSGDFHTNVGTLKFSLENAPAWMSISESSGVISGTPPASAGTVDDTAIKVVANQYLDGVATGRSGEQTLKAYIKPTYTAVGLPQIATTAKPFAVATDFDAHGSVALSYQVSSSPAIANLSVGSSGVVDGTGPAAGAGYQITVTASKAPGGGLAPAQVQETFPLSVVGVPTGQDFGPVWINIDQTGEIANASSHFTTNGGNLGYSFASGTPSWITISPESGVIDMAQANQAADANLNVIATQSINGKDSGNTATAVFDLKVNPSVTQAVLPVSVAAGLSAQVNLPTYFKAHGGSLTYSLSSSDNWVTLNGSTLDIKPPKTTTQPGLYKVTVTGVKQAGHQIEQTVDITVTPGTYHYTVNCPVNNKTTSNAISQDQGDPIIVQFSGNGPAGSGWVLKNANIDNGNIVCQYGRINQTWNFARLQSNPGQGITNTQKTSSQHCPAGPGQTCQANFTFEHTG